MARWRLLYPRSELPSIKINKHKLMKVTKRASGKNAMKMKRSQKSMSTRLKMKMEFRSGSSVLSTRQLSLRRRNFSSPQGNHSTTSRRLSTTSPMLEVRLMLPRLLVMISLVQFWLNTGIFSRWAIRPSSTFAG